MIPVHDTTSTHPSHKLMWMAVISITLTIIAWIIGSFSGFAAMGISALAIVAGAFALKSHRHSIRNTAITSIIAAAVLMVIIGAFLIVIYLGLQSI